MIEGAIKTNRILSWLRSKVRGRRMLGIAVATVVTFALLASCRYVFHSDLRLQAILLFLALTWAVAFVLDRPQAEKSIQSALPQSGKLLEQSQKMEAIGRLAGGVAHDFNNLLAVIIGYSDLLLENLGPSDLNRAKVEQIKQAANSAASLTHQLLTFSRQQVVQPVILDINQTVGNTEKMLRRLIKENIEFTVVLDRNLDYVKADPGHIEQIVLNLVVNARDAMPSGGKLRIETKNVHLDKAEGEASLGGGRYVLLEVADTGTGMDQQTQAKIFEPFFTTKALGEGTGLGLATVYGIVKQADGWISVESKPGQGATFRIFLPVYTPPAVSEPPPVQPVRAKPKARDLSGAGRILFVEDEDAVRGVAARLLRARGYEVIEAADGEEALALAEQNAGTIDLLISDVIMPG